MIGVIIARLQLHYLHDEHKSLMDTLRAKHNKIVVVLGVSPVLGSRRNPLDFSTREKMIKKEYPEIIVLPLDDHPLDTIWSSNLDTLLRDAFPDSSFRLYGSQESFIACYTGSNEVEKLPFHIKRSAFDIRKSLSQEIMHSMEFRAGIIYAYANTYLKVYPTVDIAVFRNQKTEILLGKKDIDQKWRLMGGFSDPTDDGFEAAALRELREECGEIEVTPMHYEGSFRINDWRYKMEEDKIITTLFSTDYISGNPVGSDDIGEVKWFVLRELDEMVSANKTASEHAPHFERLISRYKNW
jgi:bifunctional NMN adenylyltransferase/nudix hydrolase